MGILILANPVYLQLSFEAQRIGIYMNEVVHMFRL